MSMGLCLDPSSLWIKHTGQRKRRPRKHLKPETRSLGLSDLIQMFRWLSGCFWGEGGVGGKRGIKRGGAKSGTNTYVAYLCSKCLFFNLFEHVFKGFTSSC